MFETGGKKILLFGATGSIGIYLAEYIVNHIVHKEYDLVAIGKRKTNYFDKYGVDYYSVNITDKNSFSVLPNSNIYAAIILSGVLPARMKGYTPQDYVDVNIKGTLNIMEYLKNSGIERVIYTISISDLHGYLPYNIEFLPDMPIKYKYGTYHTVYAIIKTAATEIIKTYKHDFGIKYFILRLPNIYLYSPEKDYYVDGELRKISYRYIIDREKKARILSSGVIPSKSVISFMSRTFVSLFIKCFLLATKAVTSMSVQILW